MDCNLPGSSVHGALRTRILEWVAMPSSRGIPDPGIKPMSLASPALAGRFFTTSTSWEHVKVAQSYPTLCNPIQSMGFSRPEYWSELPFPSPGDLPNPGIEPRSPTLQADYLPAELPEKPTWEHRSRLTLSGPGFSWCHNTLVWFCL